VATLRPVDLARGHGISTQAVRNYERAGFIPPADRTPSGYRIYTDVHAAALRAYLSLIPAHGYPAAGEIMTALHADALDDVLAAVDRGHVQQLRDRDTLDSVREAVGHLTAESAAPADPGTRTIGELARRLRVTTATLRAWEAAGILVPARDPVTGYRVFRPSDVRDAEFAHLLRRGGYLLEQISAVVRQIRAAGGTDTLAGALDDWRRRLTQRGLAMLDAAAQLSHYRDLADRAAPRDPR
jgi:DNA-binding transcriptional MerR regulator